MIDLTDLEDGRHQRQRSAVVPVADACRGAEHVVAEGVVTARFARAMWPDSVLVVDLEFPLATGEPEQCGDQAAESGGGSRSPGCGCPTPNSATATTPVRARESGVGALRWGRCPNDGCLHLLQSAAVAAAITAGHTRALCGRPLSVEGLTLIHGSAGALCMPCITGIISPPAKTRADVPLVGTGPLRRRTP